MPRNEYNGWTKKKEEYLFQSVSKATNKKLCFYTLAKQWGRTPSAVSAKYYQIKSRREKFASEITADVCGFCGESDKSCKMCMEPEKKVIHPIYSNKIALDAIERLSELLTKEQKLELIKSWIN